MPGIDFRAARTQVRLREVLLLMGFKPSSGWEEQWRGPCPVHGSRRPGSRSFAAHLGRGVWHCFRCGRGGNVLDLWVAVTRQPLHAAVVDLYQRLGRPVPWLRRPEDSRARRDQREKTTMSDP
jgi:DNA primase